MRGRRVVGIGVVALLVIAVGAASASVGGSYRVGGLTATFSAPTHYPNCKQLWPVRVTATYRGRPAHAIAWYQFLYDGRLVGTQYPFGGTRRNPHNRPYAFYGSFYDNTFGPFGALAVGHKLIVRAVVQVPGIRAYPGTWVVVKRTRGCPPR